MPLPAMRGGLAGQGGAGGLPILPPPSFNYLVQPDTFPEQDNVDSTHGLAVDYFVRTNAPGILTARLSFKLRAYRTYSTFGNMSTGPDSPNHTHSFTSGNQSANHTHGIAADATGSSGHGHGFLIHANEGVASPGAGWWTDTGNALARDLNLAGNVSVNNIQSESGHSHSHAHTGITAGVSVDHTHAGTTGGVGNTHTHGVGGTTTTGVVLGGTAAGVTILFDGIDQTAALGGPWSADIIEMDVLKYIWTVKDGLMHTITLTPSGLGRINAVLRISYNNYGGQNF